MEKGVFGHTKDFGIRGIDHRGLDGITQGVWNYYGLPISVLWFFVQTCMTR